MFCYPLQRGIEMDTRNKEKKTCPRIFAPFIILKVEKMYFSWIASFAISFMSIIVDLVNGNIENSFIQGAFYSTCIALLAPFLVEFFVGYTANNRSQKVDKYTSYKGASLIVCFVIVFMLCVFYATSAKTNRIIQIGFTVLVGVFSLYLYLVSKMDAHPTLLTNYEDISYVEAEQNILDTMTSGAQNLTSAEVTEGVKVKL